MRLALRLDMRLEARDLAAAELAGDLADDQPFEIHPDVEDVARILPARRHHHRDAVTSQLHKPLGRQLPECIARNGAANAEALTQGVLGKLGAGFQSLLDDRPPQRAADHPNLVF